MSPRSGPPEEVIASRVAGEGTRANPTRVGGESAGEEEASGIDSEAPLEEGKAQKPTQSEILLRLAREAGLELFHSEDHTAYVTFPAGQGGEIRQTWKVRSSTFKLWLRMTYYGETQNSPSTQALEGALSVLESQALFDGERHEVFHRLAENGPRRIYLDLCNDAWEAVEITALGWRVVSDVPVKFVRSTSMRSLPRPKRGGSLLELSSLLNLPDESHQVLYAAFLVAALRPSGPHPLLVLQGEQGSAKSSAARFAKRLVDPTDAPLRSAPRDEHDLMIAASRSWMPVFDNLSGLPNWLSDALCRLATGGGFATRRLYTDEEEQIFSAMRPVILNGIDDVAVRQDLADRCLILHLPPIPEERRRTEKELNARFDEACPRLLGAVLDAVTCALRNLASVKLDTTPRMADFAHWGVAAEGAFPWEAGSFLRAYEGNRDDAIEQTLEADAVALAVRDLLEETGSFEGTASELLRRLTGRVSSQLQLTRAWPKTTQVMSSRLDRAAPFLRKSGLQITKWRTSGSSRRRMITIDKAVETSSGSSESSGSSGGLRESTKRKAPSPPPTSNVAGAQNGSPTWRPRVISGTNTPTPDEPLEPGAVRGRVIGPEPEPSITCRSVLVQPSEPDGREGGGQTIRFERVDPAADGRDRLAPLTPDNSDEARTRRPGAETLGKGDDPDDPDDPDVELRLPSKPTAGGDLEILEL